MSSGPKISGKSDLEQYKDPNQCVRFKKEFESYLKPLIDSKLPDSSLKSSTKTFSELVVRFQKYLVTFYNSNVELLPDAKSYEEILLLLETANEGIEFYFN